MEKYNNLRTLVENSNFKKTEEIDDDLLSLSIYSSLKNVDKNNLKRLPFMRIDTKIAVQKDKCVFYYKGKKYPFTLFSDRNLQTMDKEILADYELREDNSLVRTLKIAGSMDLINPKVIVGNSYHRILDTLISFEEDGIEKIIDYSQNIIMKAEDYFELFKFEKLNTISKNELYSIYVVLSELHYYSLLPYFLLFSKEMLTDLSKNEIFDEINVNKDFFDSGINRKNNVVLGRVCDHLFFSVGDRKDLKYKKIKDEVNDFTLNPTEESEHIRFDSDKNKYIYEDDEFGYFEFGLLSDIVDYEPIKNDLLSDNRAGRCHPNSHLIAKILNAKDRNSAYIVAGKIKATEIDYFYHSWIEIDSANIVIDYNHNLVINRDNYYKLYEGVSVQKTKVDRMDEIVDVLIRNANLNFLCFTINYFGEEIANDMMRNEKILQKK